MKSLVAFFLFMTAITSTHASWAEGKPFVCEYEWVPAISHAPPFPNKCKETTFPRSSLSTSFIAFSPTGVAEACTQEGTPAWVILDSNAMNERGINLLVGNLPCENLQDEEEIERLALQTVCEELAKQGVTCKL